MEGATSSVKVFLVDFPMLILPNIAVEPTREALIKLHIIIIANAASVTSNLGGGRQATWCIGWPRRLPGPDRPLIFPITQPGKLPTNNGNRPITST